MIYFLFIWASIAAALWAIVFILLVLIDKEKHALRMVDVDRASVYAKHLGEKLK